MDIITYTKDDNDTEGIAWVAGIIAKTKSDLFVHTHIEVTDAAEGSYVASTDGAMVAVYETREQMPSGYYTVLKATKSSVMLHRAFEREYTIDNGDVSGLFINVEGCFVKSAPTNTIQVSDLDQIAISKSYADVLRTLPSESTIVFELFVKALAGPGIVSAYTYDEIGVDLAIQMEGGRCRAKVMAAIDRE